MHTDNSAADVGLQARDQRVCVRPKDFQIFWQHCKQEGVPVEDFLYRMALGRSEANALMYGRAGSVSTRAMSAVFDAVFDGLPDAPAFGDRAVRFTTGDDHRQEVWTEAPPATWAVIVSKLTWHQEGSKEGECFVPAIFRERHRRKDSADEIYVIVLDCDDGRLLADIEAAVRRSGWTACIASTHSHLTTRTTVKASAWRRFRERHPDGTPTQFLIQEKGFRPEVAANATVHEDDVVVTFHHSPCPKFRICFLLEEPWRASDFENQHAANAAWADWIRAVAAHLGLKIDESCVDPSRLFFLPRYPEGAEHVSRVFHGVPCDPRKLPQASEASKTPTEIEVADHSLSPSLRRLVARMGRRFQIVAALKKRAPSVFVGYSVDGKQHIECPFAEQHTSADKDRATFVCDAGESRTEGFAIHCRHAHCARRDRLSFVARMLDDGWLEEADLTNERFLLPEPDPILAVVDETNEQHAVVPVGGRALIIKEEERSDGSLDVTFWRPSELKALYANRSMQIARANGATDTRKKFDVWFHHPQRRQYERVDLAPEGAGSSTYNLWRGFAFVPSVTGSCELFLHHLREIVCRGIDENYRWLLAFFAQTVQRPGEKPGVAVVLRGGQGTGKSIVGSYFGGLFPAHHVEVSRPDHLVGRFNAHHQKALLIQVEEAFWAGDKSAEGVLKHLITADTSLIEPKGVDAFAVRSIARLLITSNAYWVVPAGPDERRYAVFDVSDARQQDTDYFAALANEMTNGGRAALLSFLRSFDLSKIDLRKIPKTEALLQQKLANLPAHAQWWLGCLHEGAIGHWGWPAEIAKEELYRLYGDFAQRQRQRYRQSDSVFFRELLEMLPKISEIRLSRENKRRRGWILPDLSESRGAFDRWLNQPINWDL